MDEMGFNEKERIPETNYPGSNNRKRPGHEFFKTQVVRAAKTADKNGLCKHMSGNFSALDRNTGLVYITPSAMDRSILTEDDIIVTDLQERIQENIRGRKPSSELRMHIAVYLIRKDVNGIAHTHSTYATSFGIAGKEIAAVAAEAYFYGVRTPLCEFFRPGTEALAKGAAECLRKADVSLLRNHGVIVTGNDAGDAVLKAGYVEEVARMYYNALMINAGKEPDIISQEEFEAYDRERKAVK